MAKGIAVDAAGNAYVTGVTGSTDFRTTIGAFARPALGPIAPRDEAQSHRLRPCLLHLPRRQGAIADYGAGIAVDASGNAYVTGGTSSSDFPTTAGAFQTAFGGDVVGGGDAFVTKLNPTGSAVVYSTYLGGSGVRRASESRWTPAGTPM